MNESDAFSGSGHRDHGIGSVVGHGSIDVVNGCDRYLTALHSIQAPQVLRGMQPCSGADSIHAKTDHRHGCGESSRASVVAQLANGDERARCQSGKYVRLACFRR